MIAGPGDQPGGAVGQPVRAAAETEADNWPAEAHCLYPDQSESFRYQRGMRYNSGRRHGAKDFAAGRPTEKIHPIRNPESPGPFAHGPFFRTGAEDKKPRICGQNFCKGFQQDRSSLGP